MLSKKLSFSYGNKMSLSVSFCHAPTVTTHLEHVEDLFYYPLNMYQYALNRLCF